MGVPAGEVKGEPGTIQSLTDGNGKSPGRIGRVAVSAVKMKSAQFSGVSRVVVVQPSATLFSVYQHRDCLVAVLWRERLATILTYGETAPEQSSLPKTKQWK